MIKNKKLSTEEFIQRSKDVFGDTIYDYSLTEYFNMNTKVKIKCHVHDELFFQNPGNHLNKFNGCPKCKIESNKLLHISQTYTTEEFVEKASKIHKNQYDYSFVKYKNSQTFIDIKCPRHGMFKQMPYSHLSGFRCPHCNESKGEKQIVEILEKSKIKFIRQYKFDGCKHKYRLRFDFFLPDFNSCIEFDGKQHFIAIDKFGGTESLKYIQLIDSIKTNYCKSNNINLLRISYKEDISIVLNQYIEKQHQIIININENKII